MIKKFTFLISLLFIILADNAFAMTCSVNGRSVPCSEMPAWFGIIMVLFTLVFLVIGILSLYRPFIEWSIKFTNKLRGTKTEITPTAIKWRKIGGIFYIIFAIMVLILIFNLLR